MATSNEINQLLAFLRIITKEEIEEKWLEVLESVEEQLRKASSTSSVSTRLSLMTSSYESLSKIIPNHVFTKACKKKKQTKDVDKELDAYCVLIQKELVIIYLNIVADQEVEVEENSNIKPTILWVDDEPDNNSKEAEKVRKKGITLHQLKSTKEATKFLKSHPELSTLPGNYFSIITDFWRPEEKEKSAEELIKITRKLGFLNTSILIFCGPKTNTLPLTSTYKKVFSASTSVMFNLFLSSIKTSTKNKGKGKDDSNESSSSTDVVDEQSSISEIEYFTATKKSKKTQKLKKGSSMSSEDDYAPIVEEKKKKNSNNNTTVINANSTRKDLNKILLKDLKQFMRDEGISYKADTLKSELVDKILNHFKKPKKSQKIEDEDEEQTEDIEIEIENEMKISNNNKNNNNNKDSKNNHNNKKKGDDEDETDTIEEEKEKIIEMQVDISPIKIELKPIEDEEIIFNSIKKNNSNSNNSNNFQKIGKSLFDDEDEGELIFMMPNNNNNNNNNNNTNEQANKNLLGVNKESNNVNSPTKKSSNLVLDYTDDSTTEDIEAEKDNNNVKQKELNNTHRNNSTVSPPNTLTSTANNETTSNLKRKISSVSSSEIESKSNNNSNNNSRSTSELEKSSSGSMPVTKKPMLKKQVPSTVRTINLKHSTFSVSEIIYLGELAHVKVVLSDSYGIPFLDGGLGARFSVKLVEESGNFNLDTYNKESNEGSYEATFFPVRPGKYTVSVTCDEIGNGSYTQFTPQLIVDIRDRSQAPVLKKKPSLTMTPKLQSSTSFAFSGVTSTVEKEMEKKKASPDNSPQSTDDFWAIDPSKIDRKLTPDVTLPKLKLVMEEESSDTPENERTVELARDFKIDSETQPTQIID